MAPILAPLMKIPTAVDRSLTGNHSAQTLTPPGKLADSAAPSKNRYKLNEKTLRARLVKIPARDQIRTVKVNPVRDPTQSMKRPEKSCPKV